MPDLNRFFQAEAEDLLGKIASALELAAAEPLSEEALRELRRWAHTLKGAAQVVRREDIAHAAHRLETVLDEFQSPEMRPAVSAQGLEILQAVWRMLDSAEHKSPPKADVAKAPVPDKQGIETLRIELRELDGLLQNVNETAIVAAGIRRALDTVVRARELAAMMWTELASSSEQVAMQHAGTLADEIADALGAARQELEASSDLVQRGLDDLRSRIEDLRLVRADSIIQVLEHSVRAAASGSGKVIEVESTGGDLEFDAHLLLAARDALIQIVRNAVAHGIESPEERQAAGKDSSGRIRISFRHQGSRNLVSVADDGRGIDFDALRRKAIERGWMSHAEAQGASAEALTDLLLRPGVTTSPAANMLAGRGVGLDLVSRTVARLKGELHITAHPGRGTTVEISAPASMNSIPALIVSAGGKHFGLPRDTVRQTLVLKSLKQLAGRYVVDGRALPLVSLAALMTGSSSSPVVAAEIDAHPPFLLGLDGVTSVRQLVIHTLPDFVQVEPFVLGAAVDAVGQVLPIVSPLLLGLELEEHLRRSVEERKPRSRSLPILIVDDSLTTRMLEQSIFEMEGYSVDLASSAEEALALSANRSYGLFLVDVDMPGMDGVSFVARTRQEAHLRDIPAILVTSRGSAEDRARGLNAGARDYIVKSEFDQRYLIRRVRELIRVVE